jgi:mono/diheme cytochrome c family protein
MKIINFSFLIVFFGLLLATCTKDKTTARLINDPICDTNKVYYEIDIKPLITNNCAMSGCHNKEDRKKGYEFETYEGVMKAVTPNQPDESELYKSLLATGGKRMPPAPAAQFNNDQLALVRRWIEQGAINNTCGQVSSCNVLNVSYTNDLLPVFAANCNGCHGPGGSMQSVPTNTYVGVKAMVDANSLLLSINQNGGAYSAMPPAPASKLQSCNIDKISAWINAGAPNN